MEKKNGHNRYWLPLAGAAGVLVSLLTKRRDSDQDNHSRCRKEEPRGWKKWLWPLLFASGEVILPWNEGPSLEAVEDYYLKSTYRSWIHELTGTGIPKIRHPDFAFFKDGTHDAAGVSCADCHMPFLKVGDRKITSHEFASPADNLTVSCGICHRQSEDYLRDRITTIQGQVQGLLTDVEKELITGITLLHEARNQQGANPEALARAQELHFRAFLRYDWVFAANSKGFHNAREALLVLAEAMRLAKEMQTAAREAGRP